MNHYHAKSRNEGGGSPRAGLTPRPTTQVSDVLPMPESFRARVLALVKDVVVRSAYVNNFFGSRQGKHVQGWSDEAGRPLMDALADSAIGGNASLVAALKNYAPPRGESTVSFA